MKQVLPLLALACVAAVPLAAPAQTYPSKPVKIIVPYAPGGGTDVLTRVLAKQLSDATGQSFVVENHGGAGATIGPAMVAKAAPDGYTVVAISGVPYLINQYSYRNLSYDTIADFVPVSRFASVPMLLVSNPKFPAASAQDFVKYARDNPGKVSFGAPDQMTHLAMTIISQGTNTQVTIVPYKGAGPAITDLLGNHIPVMLSSSSAIMPYLKDGRVRALAITTKERSPSLPDVPTVSESIVPSFELNAWFAILAPANTPKAVVDFLHAEIAKAVKVQDVQERFRGLGAEPIEMLSQADFAAYLRAERDRWSKAFRDAGMQPQ